MNHVTADEYLSAPLSEVVATANRAATVCERASGILAEQGKDKRAEALVAYKVARECAAMTARAMRAGRDDLAARFCAKAMSEAGRFAHLNIDPDEVWTEPGAEDAEVKQAEREGAESVQCEDDPTKRASMGRYKKGCRCATCKRAASAYQAARRARK